MKILIINNKGQYNHRIHRTLRYLNIPSEIVSNELSWDELIEKEPIGLILGGGPSIEESGNSEEYVKKVYENDLSIPILGICLGHQIIAKTFGGKVSTADSESYAKIEIDIIKENDIFKGLGSKEKVWASHKDEVISLPDTFDIIAKSEICDVEAMKHNEKPIYGVQFHGEVHHTPNGPKIFENFYEICKNISANK
ncbi:MAG: GMP synthase subunit A [Methanobacteriaceae archaeon]